MRTTINVRDDLLQAAREESLRSKRPIGDVISMWAVRGLNPAVGYFESSDNADATQARPRNPERRNGIRLLPRRDEVITNEHIDELREALGV